MRWNLLLLLLALSLTCLSVHAGAAPDATGSGLPAATANATEPPAAAEVTAPPSVPSGAAPGVAIPAPTSPPSPAASSPTVVSTGSPVEPGREVPPAESTTEQPIPTTAVAAAQPGPGTATLLPDVTSTVLASPQFADFLKRMLEDTKDPWGARIGIGASGVFLGLLVGALLWRQRP